MQIEMIVLLVMIGSFLLANLLFKLPVSLSMALGAVLGALAGGEGFPFRHFFEGTFVYLDTMLIIATAMIFMNVIEKSGALEALGAAIVKRFYKRPAILLILLMIIIMFPGMITGSSTAAVLSAGAIVAPILMLMGIPASKTGAMLAVGAILGMAAPPVNIPAMLITGGVDMPFIGFELPLLALTLPCAIFTALFLGMPHCKNLDYEELKPGLNLEVGPHHGFKLYLPILTLLALMVLTRALAGYVPHLGMPLIFLLSSGVGIFTGEKMDVVKTVGSSISTSVPVLAKLMGVGMFIQVMTLTGARGFIVINCLGLGAVMLWICSITILPAFGAVSSFGGASVLGVPFMLAMLSGNHIITAAALSFLASMGDLMPPTALAGNYAAKIVDRKYAKVLKHCAIPLAVCLIMGLIFLIFSKNLGFLVL